VSFLYLCSFYVRANLSSLKTRGNRCAYTIIMTALLTALCYKLSQMPIRLRLQHIVSANLESLRTHSDLRVVLQIFREELSTQSRPAGRNRDDLLTDAVDQGVQRTIAGQRCRAHFVVLHFNLPGPYHCYSFYHVACLVLWDISRESLT